MTHPATVREFCRDTFLASIWTGRSADAKRGYTSSITRLATYLQTEPLISHFAPRTFAAFERWLESHVAAATRRNTVYKLRTLWREAHKRGLLSDGPPERIFAACGLPVYRTNKRQPLPPLSVPTLFNDPTKPTTPLRDLIEPYALERGLCRQATRGMRHKLAAFERALVRAATLGDLNDQTMNAWANAMLQTSLGPETARGYRSGILSLWRWAYEMELLDHRPGRIRKIKVPSKRPRAWTSEQLQEILRATMALKWTMRRDPSVRVSTFWTAFVLVGYYSGLRLGDLMALRFDQIDQEGTLVVIMNKTGDVLVSNLPADAMACVGNLRSRKRDRVFGDLINSTNLGRGFRRILRSHGLPGSVKWLRRTGATMIEAATPGAAKAHLGHRTHGLAYRNYVDPTQVQRNKPTPPSLAG